MEKKLDPKLQELLREELDRFEGNIESLIHLIEENFSKINNRSANTKISDKFVSDKEIIAEFRNVSKEYKTASETVYALKDASFNIARGEVLAIVGPSGSGKSTALQLLGGLDKPTSGEVIVNNKSINSLNERQLSKFRNETVGFVFQLFYLQPYLTVLENAAIPLILRGKTTKDSMHVVTQILEKVGLTNRSSYLPNQLSGGQMQRVAIARALSGHPKILLADEPTANLDKATALDIIHLIKQIVKEFDTTAIIVTHDEKVARQADRIIYMSDGKIL